MAVPIALLAFLWFVVVVLMILAVLDRVRIKRVKQPYLFYEQQGEDTMADMLTYTIVAAPVVAGDVVSREFSVTVDGEDRPLQTYNAGVTDLGSVTVPQDSNVVLSLVDVDDAGNRSEPAVVEFVAADTIAPGKPGAISVTLVGETTENTDGNG